MCLWAIYIVPRSNCYSAAGNMWTDPGKLTNRSQTHECENWDWGRAIPRKGRHKWDFRCCVSCTNHACMDLTDMTENIWLGKQKNASEWRQLLSVLLVIYLILRSFDIQEFRGGSGIGWDEIPSSFTISNRVEGSTYICRSSSKLWINMNFSRRNKCKFAAV